MAGKKHLVEVGKAHRFTSEKQPANKSKSKVTALARSVRECLYDDPSPLIQSLVDIATSGNEKSSDRIAAVRELLDRGYGKAPTHAPIESGDPLGYDDVDVAIRDLIKQMNEKDPQGA